MTSTRSPGLPEAPFRIDVHCHHIPDFYRVSLAEHGVLTAGGIPIPAWTPEYAVAFMDEYGIATQVVSISEPGVTYLPSAPERASMARQLNEYTKDALVDGSLLLEKRFGGFAVLPLGPELTRQDVQLACQEARYAVSTLALDGVGLFSSYGEHYLGDPRLEPLMKTLDDLGAFVFVHPVTPPVYPDLRLPTFLYEFPFDTTRAAVSLAYHGTLRRHRRIRWLLAHAGGTVPFLNGRSRELLARPGLARRIFRGGDTDGFDTRNLDPARFFYDTALSPARSAMQATVAAAGQRQVMFASDWPFAGPVFVVPGDPAPQLSESFGTAARLRVERENALAQLPGLASRLEA